MGTVDFVTSWTTLWTPIRNAVGGQVVTIIAVVGVALVVFSFISFLWRRRRGGGVAGMGSLVVPLTIGAILAGPDVVVPLLLHAAQAVVNVAVGVGNTLT